MKKWLLYAWCKRRSEVESLNGLRAMSVIGIIFQHLWMVVIFYDIPRNAILDTFFFNFNIFIDLFFVLSGFLIYAGLHSFFVKNNYINYKEFFINRSLRIFPAYYFFLFTVVIIGFAQIQILSSKPNLTDVEFQLLQTLLEKIHLIVNDVFYISNYMGGNIAHNWSLAIEEQFYITLPFFLSLFIFKFKNSDRIKPLLILYFIPLLLRVIHLFLGSKDLIEEGHFIYRATHTRFDSLFVGIIIYEVYTNHISIMNKLLKFRKYLFLTCILFFFSVLFIKVNDYPFFYSSIRYNLSNIAFGIILIFCLDEKSVLSKTFGFILFRPIARVSYSVYLWHIALGGVLFSFVSKLKGDFSLFTVAYKTFFAITAVLFFSWILFSLVEYPFLRIKENLSKRVKTNNKSNDDIPKAIIEDMVSLNKAPV